MLLNEKRIKRCLNLKSENYLSSSCPSMLAISTRKFFRLQSSRTFRKTKTYYGQQMLINRMEIIIVAAKSDNDVIGKNNELVWHLPADLRFFKQTIQGAYLITGRKSYESAQGQDIFTKDRKFIIVTRNKSYCSEKGMIAHSLPAAIEIAEKHGAERICVLGGAEIYQQAMDWADKLIITEVHGIFEGGSFFPKIDSRKWEAISRKDFPKDEENPFSYSFVEYSRRK